MDDISSIAADTPDSAERDLAAARSGDDEAFGRLVAPLHGELHAHCYRMLASTHDAEDALQEALLRAWRGLGGYEGRSSLRTWLYAIATRTCLDAVAARRRRALPVDLGPSSPFAVVDDEPANDVAWMEPYPDSAVPSGTTDPEARYQQREAVELAFVAALQHLPGNQRAALLLREVLGFSPGEIAGMMATTTASVNSALQRARTGVTGRVPSPSQQTVLRKLGDTRLRQVVTGFATALERGDAQALIGLLAEDVTWSMPPLPHWYRGLTAVTDFAVAVPLTHCGRWRTVPVTANGQPAVACYLARGGGDPYEAWAINVLTLSDARIAVVTSFIGIDHFARLGLPTELS